MRHSLNFVIPACTAKVSVCVCVSYRVALYRVVSVSRSIVSCHAFFENREKRDNSKHLIRYTFDTVWTNKGFPIPEAVSPREVTRILGEGVFIPFGLDISSKKLMSKCFDDYGVLNDDKALSLVRGIGKLGRGPYIPDFYDILLTSHGNEETESSEQINRKKIVSESYKLKIREGGLKSVPVKELLEEEKDL